MTNTEFDKHRPLKDALGRFATGIAIASCWADQQQEVPIAITINSFTSVSLEPPLVLWCLEKRASTFDVFKAASHYGISILNGDQEEISNRFAGYNPEPLTQEERRTPSVQSRSDQGSSIQSQANQSQSAPLLKTCLAALNCEVIERIDAGDHIILLGSVVSYHSVPGEPLIYFARQYMRGPHSDGPKAE